MRDKTHIEQVVRWAEFCRENPEECKIKTKDLIDSQIIIARRFFKRLSKTKEGRKILERLKEHRLRNNL